jgi:acylphosphatase
VIARLVRIEGRVQGVGFRAFVERQAHVHGISGWVRNCSDGAVEALFCGDEESVTQMIEDCRKGPRLALVTKLATSDATEIVHHGFNVRATR